MPVLHVAHQDMCERALDHWRKPYTDVSAAMPLLEAAGKRILSGSQETFGGLQKCSAILGAWARNSLLEIFAS